MDMLLLSHEHLDILIQSNQFPANDNYFLAQQDQVNLDYKPLLISKHMKIF